MHLAKGVTGCTIHACYWMCHSLPGHLGLVLVQVCDVLQAPSHIIAWDLSYLPSWGDSITRKNMNQSTADTSNLPNSCTKGFSEKQSNYNSWWVDSTDCCTYPSCSLVLDAFSFKVCCPLHEEGGKDCYVWVDGVVCIIVRGNSW